MKRRGQEKQREKSRVTGARRERGGGAFMVISQANLLNNVREYGNIDP